MTIPFNKLSELEDLEHPELRDLIGELFSVGSRSPAQRSADIADSMKWRAAMSCRALRSLGALGPDAVILGVGAGTDPTSFYLTKHARQVVATDLYLNTSSRDGDAPPLMLVDPDRFAPYPFERERLSVQHMDGRLLDYPDDTFDAVFSLGSIARSGSLDFVSNAAFEMGRVVKPGGIVSLTTDFKIAGPSGQDGWEAETLILSEERLRRYVIDASGLEPVDPLRATVSEQTLRSERDLATFLKHTPRPREAAAKESNPHDLVLVHEGYVFCLVHVALRKPETYPVTDNAWARPSEATERAVADTIDRAELVLIEQRAPQRDAAIAGPAQPASNLDALLRAVDARFIVGFNTALARMFPGPLTRLYRTILRVRDLGRVWHAESALLHALVEQSRSMSPTEVERVRDKVAAQASRVRDLEDQLQRLAYDVDSLRATMRERARD